MRFVFAAFLAALALVVAPLVSAPASAAPAFTISGTVTTDNGVAPTGFKLRVLNLVTYEDVDVVVTGDKFQTKPMPPGTYTVYAESGNKGPYAPQEVNVVVAGANVTQNIKLLRWATVRGTVTDVNNVGTHEDRVIRVFANQADPFLMGYAEVIVTDAKPSAFEIPVVPGTYKISFLSSAYNAEQFFPGKADEKGATVFTLSPGQIVSGINAVFPLGGVGDQKPITRLGGADRYATSVKITQQFAPGVQRLYIATGTGFADGLSAVPAAARFDSPLLLTETNSLPPAVKAEVQRLKPAQIVVVGGTGVVSKKVLTELEAISKVDKPVRRLQGSDRYVTSRTIANDAFPNGADVAFIATGANFPDALAAGPAAAHLGGPVILVNGSSKSLDSETRKLLIKLGVTKVKIAGGTGVVTEGIRNDLTKVSGVKEVIRYQGPNRESTAVAINKLFTSSSTAFIATSTGFADSLGGAALAGFKDAPLYLSTAKCVPKDVVTDITKRLRATNRVIIGGEGVLSKKVANLTSC